MQRLQIPSRPDWREHVERELGFLFHTIDGETYWDETACYEFNAGEIAGIENATNALQQLCLEAGEYIIANKLFDRLAIPDWIVPTLIQSWDEEPFSLYGRFDLAYDGQQPPKLLEYNADTPTSLYESAVVQWDWLEHTKPHADQFNSIHERLIAKWEEFHAYAPGKMVHFSHCNTMEDMFTATYMRETAQQAGLDTAPLLMEDIGWDEHTQALIDLQGRRISHMFKLYPWEWLLEEGGRFDTHTLIAAEWIEPVWKMMWSNKGLLAILWEMFPGHPNLLPAYFDDPRDLPEFACKPLLSREGANVILVTRGGTIETQGDYGAEGYVYQALAPIPNLGGKYPVIGSWVIDGEAAGMGIRESDGPITDNMSRFVPHYFV